MRFKVHSLYDFYFCDNQYEEGKPYINVYNDRFVTEDVKKPCVALLVEPRSIQPNVYKYMERNYQKFDYVFTHDSILLNRCPNAKPIIWGGVWGYSNQNKTKAVSMVSSDKTMCDLHIARIQIARQLMDNPLVDVYGTIDGGNYVDTETIYGDYRFSVAFENHIDDIWFTEKICNCFANRVIPIYYGARNIGDYFNVDGIIQVEQWNEIPQNISRIAEIGFEEYYNHRKYAIEDNYKRVKKYEDFNTWFLNEYEEILNDLYSETQRV